MRNSACGLVLAMVAFAGAASAAPITQTINFSFNNFVPSGLATAPSLVTEATGSVSFTYDTATPTSIFGQAVDSISFTSPTPPGFSFLTSNVMFDLKIGADKNFATNDYELEFYQDELGVVFNKVGDFLITIGAGGPIGADVPGPATGMAGLMLIIDQPGSDGFFKVNNDGALTSSSVPVTTAVAEPAPLAVLALSLFALGLVRRRRAA